MQPMQIGSLCSVLEFLKESKNTGKVWMSCTFLFQLGTWLLAEMGFESNLKEQGLGYTLP